MTAGTPGHMYLEDRHEKCLQHTDRHCSTHQRRVYRNSLQRKPHVTATVIGTARILYRTGSMQLSGVRPSVRLSVCPSVPPGHCIPPLWVCCCEPSGQDILIDCCTASGPAVSSSRAKARHANTKCGECHVISRHRKLNTCRVKNLY